MKQKGFRFKSLLLSLQENHRRMFSARAKRLPDLDKRSRSRELLETFVHLQTDAIKSSGPIHEQDKVLQ